MFQEQLESLFSNDSQRFELAKKIGFPDRKQELYRKIPLDEVLNFPCKKIGRGFLDVNSFPKEVIVLEMKEALNTYAHFIEKRKKEREKKENDYFAALADTFYEDGYFIYVPPGVEISDPIFLDMKFEGDFAYFSLNLYIFIGRNAKVEFVQNPNFDQFESSMLNCLIDIYLDVGSSGLVVNESKLPSDSIGIQSIRSSLKKESHLQYYSISEGAKFFKQDFKVELLEENAEVCLKGATSLDQKNVCHTQVLVEHKAPNAISRQHFKAVLKGESSNSFEGKIYVESHAQKTEAYQLSNNLLLSEKSQVFCKPNLEIFADDVKASHGATVSQLTEDEIFYFRSRGISEEVAKECLASGFLLDIVKDVPKWVLTQKS